MSKPKLHLTFSMMPLSEGTNIIAECGEPIDPAMFATVWDTATIGVKLDLSNFNRVSLCAKCKTLGEQFQVCQSQEVNERSYVYAIHEKDYEL